MNYTELAQQFLCRSYQFRNRGHQKKVDEVMRGEAFALLYILKNGSCVLPGEISNEMNISSARVAAILNSLEDKGFILREIDKSDRRKVLVQLTQEGRVLAKKHVQMVVNITTSMLKLLGENDAKELVRIMGRLAELMPKIARNKDE